MPVNPSALGVLMFVMPDYSTPDTWLLVCFSARSGRHTGGRVGLPSKAAARSARRRLMRHHARIARERAARAARRREGRA